MKGKPGLLLAAAVLALTCAGCSPVSHEPVEGRNWISPSSGMEFLWIPQLGLWAGKYEVTNGEYWEKVPDHDSGFQGEFTLNADRQPVVRVTFGDSKKYAAWLTGQDADALPPGYRYRLPSDDEWTALARCGDGRDYPWGDNYPPRSGRAGNYADESFIEYTGLPSSFGITGYNDGHIINAPVDALWRNPWGLYGLGGNVWEACAADSGGESFGSWRGGSSGSFGREGLRCDYRSRRGESHSGMDFGFRLVLSR